MQLSQPLPPAPVFKSPAPASTGASLADEIKAKKDLMPTVTKVQFPFPQAWLHSNHFLANDGACHCQCFNCTEFHISFQMTNTQ